MSFVLFKQSKRQELETILWTIKNHKMITEFSDVIYPKLPKKLWQAAEKDDNTFKNSRNIVKKYLLRTNQLNLNSDMKLNATMLWKRIEKSFFKEIKKITNTKPLAKYVCYLTKYGGGGSFNPSNTIWVRMNPSIKNDVKYFTYTVAHEITHLLIEKRCHGKTQKDKEAEVDNALVKTKLF